jgi:putative transposase
MSPTSFSVLWPDVGLEWTMKTWLVGNGIARRTSCASCARADELIAEGNTGEEVAAELGVSAATLYNWRRTYGGMDTDAVKELKGLLAEAELEKKGRPARGGQGKNLSPAVKRRAVDVLTNGLEHVGTVGVQGRWAGLLCQHPCHGFPRPGAGGVALRRAP